MDLRGLPLSRNVIDMRDGQPIAEAIANVLLGGFKGIKQRVDAYMEGPNTLPNPAARKLAELLLFERTLE